MIRRGLGDIEVGEDKRFGRPHCPALAGEISAEKELRGIQRSAKYKHQQQLGRWYVRCAPGRSAEKVIRRCTND